MTGQRSPGFWKRLGWLVLIWSCSVAALTLAAALIRLVMRSVGVGA